MLLKAMQYASYAIDDTMFECVESGEFLENKSKTNHFI